MSFKQLAHADHIVPMDGGVLEDPIAKKKDVVLKQRRGTIKRQAWDGRVLVELDSAEAEDEFAHKFSGLVETVLSAKQACG